MIILEKVVNLLGYVDTLYLKQVRAATLDIPIENCFTVFLQQHPIGEHGSKGGLKSALLAVEDFLYPGNE